MMRAEQDKRWSDQSSERFCRCEATQQNSRRFAVITRRNIKSCGPKKLQFLLQILFEIFFAAVPKQLLRF